MIKQNGSSAFNKAIPMSAYLATLVLVSIFGCASSTVPEAGREQGKQIVFRPLYTLGFPIVVDVFESNEIRWVKKPDATGGGRICSEDNDFECIVVDGFFTFAIPRTIAAEPWPGDHWIFEGQRFEVRTASGELFAEQDDWQLLIETQNEMGWFLFDYNARKGLEHITFINRDWDREYEGSLYMPVLEVFHREH